MTVPFTLAVKDAQVELAIKMPEPYNWCDSIHPARVHLRVTKDGRMWQFLGRLDPVGVAPLLKEDNSSYLLKADLIELADIMHRGMSHEVWMCKRILELEQEVRVLRGEEK